MQLPTLDELNASRAKAQAKQYAKDAGRFLDRAATCRNTLTESRSMHTTSVAIRRAAIDASCRVTNYAYSAAQCVGLAEHSASAACRAAKTPLAKKLAEEANKSVALAARLALEVAERACAVCTEAIKDAEDAGRAYETGTALWGRLSPDIDLDYPRSTLPTTGICRLNLE
jgi:hypothetical protein